MTRTLPDGSTITYTSSPNQLSLDCQQPDLFEESA